MGVDNPNIEKSDHLRGLGAAFPGDTAVTVKYLPEDPILRSCASAYVSNKTRGGNIWEGTIRLNLFAELRGIEGLIASAFVPPGAGGLIISASGFVADSWHIRIQALSAQVEVVAALACCTGCAEPSVQVRSGFQQPPTVPGEDELPESFLDQPMAPFQTNRGLSRVLSVEGDVGNEIALLPDERVISISAIGVVGQGGEIEYEHPDGTITSIEIEAGSTYHADPDGALVGGVFRVVDDLRSLTLITVR